MFPITRSIFGLLSSLFVSVLFVPAVNAANGDCYSSGSDGYWIDVGPKGLNEQWLYYNNNPANKGNAAAACGILIGKFPAGITPANKCTRPTMIAGYPIVWPAGYTPPPPPPPVALTPAQQELADWQACKQEALAKLGPLLNGGTGITPVSPAALQSVGMTIQTILLAGSGLQIPVANDADLSMALVDLQNVGYKLQSQDDVLNWGRAMNDAMQVPASSIPSEPTTIRIAPPGK